ncbi:hypothetical protein JCM8547_009396 [Rhodosporidiobolus lusitaniae]
MQSLLLSRALLINDELLLGTNPSHKQVEDAAGRVEHPQSTRSSTTAAPAPADAVGNGEEPVVDAQDGDLAQKQEKQRALPEPDSPELEFLVDFVPGDQLNPKNWSSTRRWIYTLMVAHIAVLVSQASSINSLAAPYAAEALNVSEEVVLLDTALFLVGFGVAAPVVGPLSEIAGRNPVYILTLLLFIIFEIGTACTSTIYARCILRFFAGCAGATPLSNAGGSLADMWSPTERVFAFPVFAATGFFGNSIGPVIGAWVGELYDYRWCDWVSAIWGALVLVTTALFMPETFAPEILKMKAAALRKKTGESRYKTALEKLREKVSFGEHFVDALRRPFAMLVLEPIVLFFSLYLSVVYIVSFGDLVAFAYIFAPYNLSNGVLGLTFFSIIVGLLLCAATTPFVYRHRQRVAARCEAENRPVQPEEHLRLAMFGTWLVPISLFWGAWTSYESVSIWSVLASQVLFGCGILCIFIASYQYIIDAYLSTAASALATLTFVRYPISGGAVMFTGPMYKSLGRHWAMSLLGFLSLAMSAIPFMFFKYGPKIRSWSRYTPKVAL